MKSSLTNIRFYPFVIFKNIIDILYYALYYEYNEQLHFLQDKRMFLNTEF